MALTTTPTELVLQKWKKEFWQEYNRKNLFEPYTGRGTNGMMSIIHQCYELRTGGEQLTIPLLAQLSGPGRTGREVLAGNEEAMDQYGHKITTALVRNAVELDQVTIQQSAVDQLNVVRPLLTNWTANRVRDDIVKAFGSIDGVDYGAATAGQRNTWAANNVDRLLYGAALANSSGIHGTDLGKLDVATDRMSSGIASTAKRLARSCSPLITPVKVDGGRDYFVMFHGMRAFRDLKNDTAIQNANREARSRDHSKNPLFQDGDLIYDGVIHVEIPEIDSLLMLATAGDSNTPVAPSFLCGTQAVGHAFSQMPRPTTKKEDDYDHLKGRGIDMYYGIDKIRFNGAKSGDVSRDWGVVTVWSNTPGDA